MISVAPSLSVLPSTQGTKGTPCLSKGFLESRVIVAALSWQPKKETGARQ
jgi:hypothetical protein